MQVCADTLAVGREKLLKATDNICRKFSYAKQESANCLTLSNSVTRIRVSARFPGTSQFKGMHEKNREATERKRDELAASKNAEFDTPCIGLFLS